MQKNLTGFNMATTTVKKEVGVGEYVQLIGSILWVASMSRPDIAYYCSRLTLCCKAPTKQQEYYGLCGSKTK